MENPQLIDYGQAGVPFSDITLRDLFAGLAMQTFCQSEYYLQTNDHSLAAKKAYAQADAMLKARGEGK